MSQEKKSIKIKLLYMLAIIKSKINIKHINKDKIKEFALSNTGITVIVLTMALFFVLISYLKHHASSSLVSNESINQWNNSPVPSELTTENNNKIVIPAKNDEIKSLKAEISDLKQSNLEINQRLIVITKLINEEKQEKISKHLDKKPYLLLGVHLDEGTNQWVADVQYEDKVISVTSGQQFGGWIVRNVDAQGAKIE